MVAFQHVTYVSAAIPHVLPADALGDPEQRLADLRGLGDQLADKPGDAKSKDGGGDPALLHQLVDILERELGTVLVERLHCSRRMSDLVFPPIYCNFWPECKRENGDCA